MKNTKKKSILPAIVIVGLMAVLTVSLASADTFSASQDSHIHGKDYQQDRNYGADEYLDVESYLGYHKRALAQFDVSSIPSGAAIDSATLYLYMYDAPAASRTHEVHRITNSWVEGTGYQIGVPSDGVTWINRSTGVTWNNPGVDYVPSITDNTTTGTANGVWLTWDVASDVQQFVSGVNNYGWLIKDETEGSTYPPKEAWFVSRENTTDTSKRPKLEVEWHEAPSVNLTVERIDPVYVIENMTNVMLVYVKNTGTVSSYTGNVSLEVRNSSGVIYSAKNTTNLSTPAAASVEVRFAWKPPTVENVTLNATADCDNDIAESNEGDNSLIDNRNTTGDCTTDTLVAEACYGYRGQHPMDNTVLEYKDKLGVIYTFGDYRYDQDSVKFQIGGESPDTNRITGEPAEIPAGAEVVLARLYVYYTWRDFDSHGYPDLGMQFWDQTHAAQYPAEEVNYTDWKGFTDDYTHYLYGTVVYNVTEHVPGNSGTHPYQADITQFYWGSGDYGTTSGMALLIVYRNDSEPYRECYVDEGCDRLATRYWSGSEGRWGYYVMPDDATTEAVFPYIGTQPVQIMNATLFTTAIDGIDSTTGNPCEETLGFNGNYWQGAWSNGGGGSAPGSTYPIGYDSRDVKDELQDNPAGSSELAEFQERYTNNVNGFSAANAILILETELSSGVCYSGTWCNVSIVSANKTCGQCINAGLGSSWKNYEFESPCEPGYTVPQYCWDTCPQCCDGGDNDLDGKTDWPDDEECGCCLDNSELSGVPACPEPCIPELATVVLFGVGLLALVGYVEYRKRKGE